MQVEIEVRKGTNCDMSRKVAMPTNSPYLYKNSSTSGITTRYENEHPNPKSITEAKVIFLINTLSRR